jgi:hypothetical protein
MFKRTAILMLFCAPSLLPGLLLAGETDSSLVATSRFDDMWRAYSTSGKINIELREIRVETPGPNGKPMPERILVIFEPRSGAFSWCPFGEDSLATDASNQTKAFENKRAVFLKGDSLVVFMGGISPKLYVRDFRGHARDMNDAEAQALRAATEFQNPPSRSEEAQLWHIVPLPSLGRAFVTAPMSAVGGPDPNVTDVGWDGQNWIVTLQGRWTEQIILDPNYNVVSMQKVE